MAGVRDLHILPKVRDSWSYLYVEHGRIDQEDKAIAIHDERGKTPVPCATLSLLMLGPGTSITHAAIRTLAESGCLVEWSGEQGVRFYAQGMGETRSSANLLRQMQFHSDPTRRLQVVRRMYELRFPGTLDPKLTLQQIRGKEGIRVREMYAHWSRETGVKWSGRDYTREKWDAADPINRALSSANSCLYGIVHAAVVAAGYSPAIGFIHTGKMLSFIYDVGDLYKASITIPAAFKAVKNGEEKLEMRVRKACRDTIQSEKLLERIIDDLGRLFNETSSSKQSAETAEPFADDAAAPGGLWDPEQGDVAGGINYADG